MQLAANKVEETRLKARLGSCAGMWAGVLAILLCGCFLSTRLAAQATTASVVGTVHDETGAAVPNAEVVLTNKGTAETRKVVSAENGSFTFNLVAPGSYSVTVTAPSFKRFEVPNLTLAAGDSPRVDAGLAVGATSETVSVEAVTPLLQSESSALQSSVNQQAVQDLPLNGRNFVQLVQLVVGANEGPPGSLTNGTKPDDKRQSASFSANGQSEVLNNQMIDGLDNNESLIGSVGIRPSVEAVSEIRVQTSVYSADTGRTGGAAVNIITKSGTNHLHGSAYEYFRNDVFNSYPFQFGTPACSATLKYPNCNPKQELRQNQFGASIGGPIRKDKTFFFGDYEGFRLVSGANPTVSTVPTAFEEQNFGNLSDQPNPANQFPITTNFGTTNSGYSPTATGAGLTIDPVAADYMQFYPTPTRTAGGTCTTPGVASTCSLLVGQFVGIAINTQFSNVFDIRLDHQIGPNDQIYGRYSYNNVKTWNPGVFGAHTVAGVTLNPTGGGYSPSNDHSVAITYAHTFTQNLIAQLQVGYLRVVDSTYPAFFGNGNTVGPAADTAFGMPGVNISAFTSGLAHVGMASGGYTALGGGAFTPLTDQTQAYQGLGTVTYTHGNHNLKFGAGLIRRHLTSVQSAAGLPQYTMAGALWGFETGIYTTDNRLLATTNPHYRRWEPSVYAQDDWHVTNNTTLNLGIRYDVFTPLTEINNNISTWNPVTEVIMVAGTPGVSPSANVRTYYGNVAPRIGFATTLRPGFVIRGGFAFSYYPDSITSNATPKNPPLLASFGPFPSSSAPAGYQYLRNGNPPLGSALFQNINPANPVGAIRAATDPNFRPGMVEQFTVSTQKDFHGNVLTVAYVGTLERHTPQSFTDLNAPNPTNPTGNVSTAAAAAAGCTSTVTAPGSCAWNIGRPYFAKYPGLNTVGWYASEGSGSYHAAQISFERRLSHGVAFNTNYTYSRNLDNAVGLSNQNTTAYGYWVPISHTYDYGNSDLDLRNRFVVNINYTLPFAQTASGLKGEAFKGWQLNTITAWNAGQPVTPVNSTSISGTESTNGGDRPNRVGSPTALGGAPKTISHFFNTAAYTQQTGGTFGNSERNSMYGPHYRHVDLSLIKQFPIKEAVHLEFRAEGFNITNTANFSTPNVTLQTASTYGTITSMSPSYTPRVIQFALKLLY
jgi:hypothetical protein